MKIIKNNLSIVLTGALFLFSVNIKYLGFVDFVYANDEQKIVRQDKIEKNLDDSIILESSRMQLLKELSKRKDNLDKVEAELKLKQDLINIAMLNLDKKIDQMKQLEVKLDSATKKFKLYENTRLKSLAKIYENMKPPDAAKIFNELDMDTLFNLVINMKEIKLAPIIANMNVIKAKNLSVELTRKIEALIN